MDKHQVDSLIKDYIKPLYGFALNKTGNISEAEELAGIIILEVYQTLLKKSEIYDVSSYVFKIAHYVWAKYVGEKVKISNRISIEDDGLASIENGFDDIMRKETEGALRREIAFLSHQQREIVIKYYFDNMKISEIATIMKLSSGTVKWHLFEAKKELKQKVNTIRAMGELGINPIRLTGLGHSGSSGSKGDTADFLATSIRQNIAYAAYYKPVTVNEMAVELGISPLFIKDEIEALEEYGYIDRRPGGKYLTNMYISDSSQQKIEALHDLFEEYAEIVVEHYFKAFLSMEKNFKDTGVYIPGGDFNLLLWSLIPYAGKQLSFQELEKVSHQELSVKRKDGGNFIAFAHLNRDIETSIDHNMYSFCGDMMRTSDEMAMEAWQFNTYWCDRPEGWRDNWTSDFISLMHVINGDLTQSRANIDVFGRLFAKQYLSRTDSNIEINIVYCKNKQVGERLHAAIPAPSAYMKEVALKLDQAVYQINIEGQPAHAHKYVAYMSQNSMAAGHLRAYIMKHLVDVGLLTVPDSHRQKGISTIMFMNQS